MASTTTAVTVVVSAFAAFSIVRYRTGGGSGSGRLILFKYLLPTAMLFVPLYVIVVALGLGNTLKSLMLTYLSFTVPFCTWMLMGYFRSIPPELEEHAMVDGCTKIGALFRILFPLSAPGIVASAIFSFTLAWNEFLLALVFTSDHTHDDGPHQALDDGRGRPVHLGSADGRRRPRLGAHRHPLLPRRSASSFRGWPRGP